MANWPLYKRHVHQQPVNFIELGVDTGRSLELWEKILPKGSRLSGVDIDYSRLEIPKDKYRLFTFDTSNSALVNQNIVHEVFDVIMDDACPHLHIETFYNFAPLLRRGGAYFMETFRPKERQPIEALRIFMKLSNQFKHEFEFEYPSQHNEVIIIARKK